MAGKAEAVRRIRPARVFIPAGAAAGPAYAATFTIPGRVVPKPRMTRSDKWKQRPVVVRYQEWVLTVKKAYIDACSRLHKPPVKFAVCSLGFTFSVAGSLNVMDLSNCIKGIEDALIGIAYEDDTMQYVRQYDKALVYNVKESKQEMTAVTITNFGGGEACE